MPVSTAVFGAWNNPNLILYHGTLDMHVPLIRHRVNRAAGRGRTDFGRGFYTTTVLGQACQWARMQALRRSPRLPPARPAVVSFRVSRDDLAKLQAVWFVRATRRAHDFWSLVAYCHGPGAAHGRAVNSGWYDVAIGPVAASWRRRVAIPNSDQVSFHTRAGEKLLKKSIDTAIVLDGGKWRSFP
jgi:hypothetical protein